MDERGLMLRGNSHTCLEQSTRTAPTGSAREIVINPKCRRFVCELLLAVGLVLPARTAPLHWGT